MSAKVKSWRNILRLSLLCFSVSSVFSVVDTANAQAKPDVKPAVSTKAVAPVKPDSKTVVPPVAVPAKTPPPVTVKPGTPVTANSATQTTPPVPTGPTPIVVDHPVAAITSLAYSPDGKKLALGT